MRKLLWVTVGFAAATTLFAYWVRDSAIILLAAICLLFSIGSMLIANTRFRVIALILLGCSFGFFYSWGYDSIVLSTARAYDGRTLEATVEATDYAYQTEYGYRVNGKMKLDQRDYSVCLYFSSLENVKPGDRFVGTYTLRYTPEGGEKPTTFHKGEGRFLIAYAEKEIDLRRCQEVPAIYYPAVLRKNLSERITRLFPKDTAAFSKALLLGEDGEISFSDDIAFQKSGIRHVIAVSGLHVSILFSLVYFVTGRRRFLSLLLGIPVLFLFCAVAGFSPSVMRAGLMQVLLLIAAVLNKEYDPGTALSFAVLIMLLLNPLTITSVSFQLSVGCMIGIFLFSRHIQNYLKNRIPFGNRKDIWARLKGWLVGSVGVSVSAMTVTLPLCAFYFGTVGVVGILTNLLSLWVIPYIFIGILIACASSYLWLPLGTWVAFFISFPERYVLGCAKVLSKIPMGTLYTQSPYTVLWLVATCGLLIFFLFLKKKPAALFATAVVTLYLAAAGFSMLEPYFHNFEVTVVDVGQGQCVILQSKSRVYMVDCGSKNGEDAATAALRALGVRGIQKLDGLILTHYDSDHCNGASYLMDCLPVDTLYLPSADLENPNCAALKEQGVPVVWVNKPQKLTHPTGEIQIFPPENAGEGNESSLSILFQSGTYDILITGDTNHAGEASLLQQGLLPDLEVLVVGHHGAKTSTGLPLLTKTKPELAVISVGASNLYGHPHSETIKRLGACGCIVRRTDLEGTITIRG